MNAPIVRLIARDGFLFLPRENDPLVAGLQLIKRYQEGDADGIKWPSPNKEHLRSTLFDARETGDMLDVPSVLLPDGNAFWIDKSVDDWKGVYPGMCINPEICRGKSHCPRDHSCCE